VRGSNSEARAMLPGLASGQRSHCSELFAQPWEALFDAADRAEAKPQEVALWSGLRLSVLPVRPGSEPAHAPAAPLRDVEIALIRKAVSQARGNVAEAAKALGISRATVYRKLARKG
jgi:transcriptional regulator of acetoin/glycerol metabolism